MNMENATDSSDPRIVSPPEFAYRLPEVRQPEAITVTISFPADWMPLIQTTAESRRAQSDAIWFGQIMQKIAIAHARDEQRDDPAAAKPARFMDVPECVTYCRLLLEKVDASIEAKRQGVAEVAAKRRPNPEERALVAQQRQYCAGLGEVHGMAMAVLNVSVEKPSVPDSSPPPPA